MNKFYRKAISIFIALAILLCSIPTGVASAASSVRPSAANIPNSSLIIGTHIIHLAGLNTELLSIALQSAQDSQQEELYYKSEFSDGTWYNISSASEFVEISTQGKPVNNSVIDALTLAYWTKEDGKTYELEKGTQVDIHKIYDPSKLSTLPELAELNTRLSMVNETAISEAKQNGGVDSNGNVDISKAKNETKQKRDSLHRIVGVPFSSPALNDATSKMDALEKYINYLRDKDTHQEWIDEVVSMKGSLNNLKLILCYEEAIERLNNEIPVIEDRLRDDKDNKVTAADLVSAYYSCLDSVNKTLSQLQSSMVSVEASTALNKESDNFKNSLINSVVTSNNYSAADVALSKYMAVKNIVAGIKLDIPLELSVLRPVLASTAKELFALTKNGATKEYTNAVKAKETKAIISAIKAEQISENNNLSTEILDIIDYIKQRENDAAKLTMDISGVLNDCLSTMSVLPKDDFYNDDLDILKRLMNSLNAELALLKSGASDNKLLEKLQEIDSKIKELSNDYLSALDNRDLELANAVKADIDTLSKQKADIYNASAAEKSNLNAEKSALEKELSNALSQGNTDLAMDLLDKLSTVNAALDVSSETSDELSSAMNTAMNDLLASFETSINKGDYNDAKNTLSDISALLSSSPSSAGTALSILENSLSKVSSKYQTAVNSGSTGDANTLKDIKSMLESLLGIASKQESGDSKDALKSLVLNELNSLMSASGLNTDSVSGQLLKLSLLDALKNNPQYSDILGYINELQDNTLQSLDGLGGKYRISNYMHSNGVLYFALKDLSLVTGRRYVWKSASGEASLSKGNNSIVFTAGSKNVKVDGKSESMPSVAKLSNKLVYVPATFIAKKLGVSYKLCGSKQAPTIIPNAIEKLAQSLLK